MKIGQNNIDKKLDDQFIIMKTLIDANTKYTDALNQTLNKRDTKFTNINYDFDGVKKLLKQTMVHNQH